MTYYMCADEFDAVLCGIYDAWGSGLGHANVRVQIDSNFEYRMFCDYRAAAVDEEKTKKVIRSVKNKISEEAYFLIYKVFLSNNPDRADVIYRFLIDGFRYGAKVTQMLKLDSVFRVFEICRFVGNENHQLLEFIRFEELDNGVLFSRIHPRNNLIYLVPFHFADRLPEENWIIYDMNRRLSAVHEAGKDWFVTKQEIVPLEVLRKAQAEKGYQDLWKLFFDTIAVESRINPRCQRNFLPLHYRDVMTEFQ